MKKLCWNVLVENWNEKKIENYNIFNHYGFCASLLKAKKMYKNDFEKFSKEVKGWLMYYYWSKSEWEVIVTTWPAHITTEQLDELIAEKEKVGENKRYRYTTDLCLSKKIDVFDQINQNWDVFINYLYSNMNLITKKKLGLEI